MCLGTPSNSVMTDWLLKPTMGPEQRAIGHGVAVRQRFSAFGRCARLRDGEARSTLEASGAGAVSGGCWHGKNASELVGRPGLDPGTLGLKVPCSSG
jgi:hypothetical protein